jgi:hypothetical protein
MAMSPKFIESPESIEYKKKLKEFSQLINPKQSEEIIEQLREKYRMEREGK